MRRRLIGILVGFAFVLTVAGCPGSSNPKITGKVMLDGSPLTDADLSFEKLEKGSTARYDAKTDAEGKYQVVIYGTQPVEPGTYRVAISKFIDQKGKVTDPGQLMQLKMAGLAKNIVPAKYNDPTMATLTAELRHQDMEIPTIDLKGKGK
jgi:hypothetical protein